MSTWQRWVRHPESCRARQVIFDIHLWVGVGVGLYIRLMGISGSMIVYRRELETRFSGSIASVEWLMDLHENLLAGSNGRLVNGMGAIKGVPFIM